MSDKVKTFEFEGNKISFDFGEGTKLINATQMAKPFGKTVNQFFRLKQTAEYIDELHKSLITSRSDDSRIGKMRSFNAANLAKHYPELIKVIKGGDLPQGTWVNEKIAVKFAAWLSPKFEVWVFDTILDILTNQKAQEIELLKWYLKKLTDNIDDARNLLDSIPFQDEKRRRIK